MSMEHKNWYQLGKRDAVAEVLAMVRLKGERQALLEISKQLLDSDSENPNPHAKWYLENHKAVE